MIFISGNQSEIYNSPFPKVGLDLYFYVHSGFTQIETRIIQSYFSADVRMLHFSCGRKSDMERASISSCSEFAETNFWHYGIESIEIPIISFNKFEYQSVYRTSV